MMSMKTLVSSKADALSPFFRIYACACLIVLAGLTVACDKRSPSTGDAAGVMDAGGIDVGEVDARPGTDARITELERLPNRCGPAAMRVGPELYRPPEPPDDVGPTPRLLWQTNQLCAGAEHSLAVRASMAYGDLEIEGQRRRTLAVVNYVTNWGWVEPMPGGVAWLEPRTGTSMGCQAEPDGINDQINEILPMASSLGRYFYLLNGYDNVGRPEEEQWIYGAVRIITGPEQLPGWKLNTYDHSSGISPGIHTPDVLTAQGQYIVTGRDRLVSFDAFTGEILWTRSAGSDQWPGLVAERPFIQSTRVFGDDEVVVAVSSYGEWDVHLYRINECGEPSLIAGFPEKSAIISKVDNIYLVYTIINNDNKIALSVIRDGEIIVTINNCVAPVAMSDSEFACIRSADKDHGQMIIRFSSSGESSLIDLPRSPLNPSQVGNLDYGAPWLIAGQGGVLITSASIANSAGGSNYRFFFIRGDEISHFDLPEPQVPFVGGGISYPPLLTPDGLLIVAAFDYLSAIQTDIYGYAPSPYPRSYLGGNENRGYVVVPEGAGESEP